MNEIGFSNFASQVNVSRLDLISKINANRVNPIPTSTSLQEAINIANAMFGSGSTSNTNDYDLILNGLYGGMPTYLVDQIMGGGYIVEF